MSCRYRGGKRCGSSAGGPDMCKENGALTTKPHDYEREMRMFEISFQRPRNYFKLSTREQRAIDKRLGILDWDGKYLSDKDRKRFNEHYQ